MNNFSVAGAPPSRLGAALALLLLQGACGGGTASDESHPLPRADDPDAALGDGVSVYGMRYPLTAAIGEIWGRRLPRPGHFNVDYLLTNGPFAVTPIVADGESTSVREPINASIVLRAELYAADAGEFRFADYVFVAAPEEAPGVDGRDFFTAARLGIDADGSGDVEEAELLEVRGGVISFEGPLPDITLTFSLELENGERATGSYGGFFEFIQR